MYLDTSVTHHPGAQLGQVRMRLARSDPARGSAAATVHNCAEEMISRRHSQKVDSPNEHRCDEEAMHGYPKVVPVRIIATADDLCVTAEDVSSTNRIEELCSYCDGSEQQNASVDTEAVLSRRTVPGGEEVWTCEHIYAHAEPRRTKERHGRRDQLV